MRTVPFQFRAAGFTLTELMVSMAILMVLGMMLIGFMRGAVTIARTGAARGKVYESAQVVMRLAAEDFAQVLGPPAREDGPEDSHAFVVQFDPFGRQLTAFTRAFGEEMNSLAAYDAGRGTTRQGWAANYEGWNVHDRLRPTGANLEVVYMLLPTPDGAHLYRAVQAPPGAGGLVDDVVEWLYEYPAYGGHTILPMLWWEARRFDRRFNLVAENVLMFCVECWDDNTQTWQPRTSAERGPLTRWSWSQRRAAGRYPLPLAVKLTVIIGAEQPLRAEAGLLADLRPDDTYMALENVDNFPDPGTPDAYVRIGGEIIAYGTRGGGGLGSLVRGCYGTRASEHEAGARVRAGEVFSRIIHLPVRR